jgi:hypothetical protein
MNMIKIDRIWTISVVRPSSHIGPTIEGVCYCELGLGRFLTIAVVITRIFEKPFSGGRIFTTNLKKDFPKA